MKDKDQRYLYGCMLILLFLVIIIYMCIVDTVLKEYQFQQNENRVQAEKLIEAVNMFNRIMLE